MAIQKLKPISKIHSYLAQNANGRCNENRKADQKEQEGLESFNKGKWGSTKEGLNKYKQAAKQTNIKVAQQATQGK